MIKFRSTTLDYFSVCRLARRRVLMRGPAARDVVALLFDISPQEIHNICIQQTDSSLWDRIRPSVFAGLRGEILDGSNSERALAFVPGRLY
ncbi:MAG: hypothetical protein ACR2MC_03090 [Actinomycetota bacterium]